MTFVYEIDPTTFEQELRRGDDVVVLDTRDATAYAEWRVEPAGGRIVNVAESALAGDPDLARSLVGDATSVRVVCNAGNASKRVVALLADQGIEALSVEGGMIGWSRVLQHDPVPLAGPLTVVQFRREARGCLSYLVTAGDEALVVDPAPDVDPYLAEAEARGVRIVRIFDTHVHADHLSGGRALAERTGATLSLSHGAVARGVAYADDIEPVGDGDTFSIGGATVTVVGLPGHTTDMTGLLLGDAALVGGDSLFADSVARPDLEAGDDGAEEAARQLHATLRSKVATLPGTTVLLPCHYAGGRLHGPVALTLDEVRAVVPELGLDEDAFVARVLGHMPPKPTNFMQIIGVNLGLEPFTDDASRLEVGANNCAAKAEWATAAA